MPIFGVFQITMPETQDRMNRLQEHMTRMHKHMTRMEEHIAKMHEEMSRLDGDNTRLKEQMGRLEQALVEERTARRADVDSLRNTIERQRSEIRRCQLEKGDVMVQTMVSSQTSRDVAIRTDRQAATAREQVNISCLNQEQLSYVLQFLDGAELFRVRRGK